MKSKFIKFATSSFMSFLIDYALFCECSVQLYDKLPSGFQRKADN